MAAYVSTANGSATQAYRDGPAGGGGACRPGVRPHRGAAAGHAADARQADGGGRGGAGDVRGALAVCAVFNTTGRLADAFGFEVLSPGGFAPGPSTCSSAVTARASGWRAARTTGPPPGPVDRAGRPGEHAPEALAERPRDQRPGEAEAEAEHPGWRQLVNVGSPPRTGSTRPLGSSQSSWRPRAVRSSRA